MVTVQAAQATVAMAHLRGKEAARAVTEKVAMSKVAVAATRAVMVLWIATPLTTVITVAPAHAITLVVMAAADSKAAARVTTAIVLRHAAATATVIRKLTINQY